jgi:hypothetical protein|tara:strand:- start:45926 stop:46036 length:111 start_codon:yes stop_codon:yes gene_type:complete
MEKERPDEMEVAEKKDEEGEKEKKTAKIKAIKKEKQ